MHFLRSFIKVKNKRAYGFRNYRLRVTQCGLKLHTILITKSITT